MRRVADAILRRWFRGWIGALGLAAVACSDPAERPPCFARAMLEATARYRLECRGQTYEACAQSAEIERELADRMRACP